MNKLLQKQLSEHIENLAELPEGLRKFLTVISESYDHFEKDRKMLERSIELSSGEMITLHNQLRKEAEEGQKEIFEKLKESLTLLNDEDDKIIPDDLDYIKLAHIADLLKNETTKRRATDSELRKANYELKTLFENMQECAFTVDMTTYKLIQITPSCLEIYGYSVEDFLNNDNLWLEVVVDEDKTLAMEMRPNLERGEPIINSYRIHHRNGTVRWLESKIKPTLNKEGKLVRLDGVTADITKRVEAEQAVKDSEHKFRSLIQNSSDGILVADENAKIIFVSDSAYNITGYTPEEVVGLRTFEFIHPDDLAYTRHILQKLLKNPGKADTVKYRRLKKDGTYIWVESTVINLLNQPSVKGIVANFRDITDRVDSEQALKNSEYRFRTLIEHSSDAIVVLDVAGITTYASDTLRYITGFLPGEIVGTNTINQVHPDDRQLVLNCFEKTLKDPDKAESVIYRRLKKDNTYIWCEGVFNNLLNDQSIHGVVVNFRDITERVEAEQALRDSEYRFRTLIENSSDATVVINEKFEIVFASDSLWRVTGYMPDEVIGHNNADTVYSEDRQIAEDFLKDILSSPGKAKNITYRVNKKDGEIIWTERVATNLINDPVIKGIVINFRDITESKDAELALKESEYKFRSLIVNASDVITVVDKDSRFAFASESIYRVTGYRPEELIGKPTANFIHPDDVPLLKKSTNKVLDNPGVPLTIQYRRLKKNGEYFWCEGTGCNLLNEPSVNGIVINFKDITERVENEEAIKASNVELKKSNSELDRFVYSVSHDLRAPLSSMLGVISLIEDELTQDNVKHDIQLLKSSINKLDGFITDILDYSRNSRLDVNREEVHFDELLSDVKTHLKHMASANSNVDIRLNIDNGKCFYSDASRLSVILNNLISNSIRYSDPKADHSYVELDIKVRDDEAVLVVKDNGVGINKEYHDKVFDMFYRVSKKSVGSGLGLYIVKETVEKLHGTIKMDSEPGKGTQFTVTIPNLKSP